MDMTMRYAHLAEQFLDDSRNVRRQTSSGTPRMARCEAKLLSKHMPADAAQSCPFAGAPRDENGRPARWLATISSYFEDSS
jgi:hypothetical protein